MFGILSNKSNSEIPALPRNKSKGSINSIRSRGAREGMGARDMVNEIDYNEKSLPFRPMAVREHVFNTPSINRNSISPTFESSAISPMIQGNPGAHQQNSQLEHQPN